MSGHRYFESYPREGKNLPILHNQKHWCWCPGDESQCISHNDSDLVKPGQLGPRTLRINLQLLPGGRLNNKDGLTRYGDSHVKDKTS